MIVFSEWNEGWAEFKKSRVYPYIRTVARTGLMYLIFSLMLSATLLELRYTFVDGPSEYFDNAATPILLCCELILAFLILNTVLLTFSMFSRSERKSFLESATEDYSKKSERKKLLRSPYFLTETATLICFLFLFPCSDTVESIFKLWLGEWVLPPALIRLIHGCLFGIPAFFINIYGHMDARAYWLELPGRLSKNNLWKSMTVKKKQSYSYFRMALRLVGYAVIYVVAGMMIPSLLVVFASVVAVLILVLASVGVLTLIGLILSLNYLGALIKRRKFYKKLKKLCEENGFELRELNHPYLSVFRETDGYNFSIYANGQTYYARVISCINRGNHMVFDTKGMFTRIKIFRIPFPRLGTPQGGVARGRFIQGIDRGTGDDRELFRVSAEVDYTFEAPGKKLLILNPPAKFVKISIQGKLRDADNGDRVGEYTIYSSGAFLRALDRNAIQ